MTVKWNKPKKNQQQQQQQERGKTELTLNFVLSDSSISPICTYIFFVYMPSAIEKVMK